MSMERNKKGEAELRLQCANALLRIATMFQASEKAEWVPGPPRSVPGEHLRIDTGNARDALVYTPTSPKDVARTLEVRVGYRVNAWYASYWEQQQSSKRRKGLLEKLVQFQNTGITNGLFSSYKTQ